MTRKEALIALRDAVRDDDTSAIAASNAMGDVLWSLHVMSAHRGSLDAATTLHLAVRVGWIWGRQQNGAMWIAKGSTVFKASPMMHPARGLLLCDIEALISEADE